MLLNTVMLNAVVQTELENDRWQLIGFMGPQGSKSSVSYRADPNREIQDIADENTTYLVKEDATANGQLAYKTGLLASPLPCRYILYFGKFVINVFELPIFILTAVASEEDNVVSPDGDLLPLII
jgi:hypothetical protein